MPDLVVTPTAIALASAGWFAAKVLGPSVDSAGKGLDEFFTSRWNEIVRRAGEIAEPKSHKPLPVGFLYLAAQKASFSEDCDTLTDMWAALLVSASESVDHRHALFADVLTQIGGDAARALAALAGSNGWRFEVSESASLERELYGRYRQTLDWNVTSADSARKRAGELLQHDVRWPVLTVEAKYNWYNSAAEASSNSGIETISDTPMLPYFLDVLTRQRLVSEFDFDFHPGWASPGISGVYLTRLGKEFLVTCDPTRRSAEL